MAAIAPDYLKILQTNPKQSFSVIIRAHNNPQAKAAQLINSGLTITQTFSLIPGFAVTGPASDIITLLDEPWVISIEPDEPVKTSDE
ncbi:MAG TPA: hypothetical protein G4N96_01245 [Chloroflexi bacterium]|nr:hypothetical protein [Chloroflexota bacterium]